MASKLLKETFVKVLHDRNKGLLYKWSYNGKLTNCEKDEIAMASRIARKIAGSN